MRTLQLKREDSKLGKNFLSMIFKSFKASHVVRIVSALYYDSSLMRLGHSRVSEMIMDIFPSMGASIFSNLSRFGHNQVDLKKVQHFVTTDVVNFK